MVGAFWSFSEEHCPFFLRLRCTCFGSTYTKIGTIQRRLAWPLRKDDTQKREAFHIFRPAPAQRSKLIHQNISFLFPSLENLIFLSLQSGVRVSRLWEHTPGRRWCRGRGHCCWAAQYKWTQRFSFIENG